MWAEWNRTLLTMPLTSGAGVSMPAFQLQDIEYALTQISQNV